MCPKLAVPSVETDCQVVRIVGSKRVPWWAKGKCFSAEDYCLVDPPNWYRVSVSGETSCKVVLETSTAPGTLVSWWATFQCFLVEGSGLIEFLHFPELVVSSGERPFSNLSTRDFARDCNHRTGTQMVISLPFTPT